MLDKEGECARPTDGTNSTFNNQNSALGIGGICVEFQVPVEVIAPAFGGVSDSNRDRDHGTPPRFDRSLDQPHVRFVRSATALSIVTAPAGRHDIFPGLPSTLGDGYDVVEGQFFGSESMIAILAGIAVASKNIDAGKLDGPVAFLEFDEFEQPHHCRKPDRNRNPVNFAIVHLQDFNLALPEQRDGFLPMEDSKRLIRRIEQQRHFHSDPGVLL